MLATGCRKSGRGRAAAARGFATLCAARVRLLRLFGASALISATLLFSPQLALAQFTQQGNKLVGTGAVGGTGQGISVALSADGNTAIVGGHLDNSAAGAAWVYTRSGGVWIQQGSKLVGTGGVGITEQGTSVALSADGNTAIVGGPADNFSAGAVWVYSRSGGVWTQQGSKLLGTGGVGGFVKQGFSVALAADGNTAIVGGPFAGAVWVFVQGTVCVPFSAFNAKLEIDLEHKPNKDRLELLSSFTLGSASNGIKPATEPVTLKISALTTTIPPGSFKDIGLGIFVFHGVIGGVRLEALIAPTGSLRYALVAAAQDANLTGTVNPVPMTLTIGDDCGTASVTALIIP